MGNRLEIFCGMHDRAVYIYINVKEAVYVYMYFGLNTRAV